MIFAGTPFEHPLHRPDDLPNHEEDRVLQVGNAIGEVVCLAQPVQIAKEEFVTHRVQRIAKSLVQDVVQYRKTLRRKKTQVFACK